MPIYMKYEGITGTGKGKYNGWIELESCQIGKTYRTNGRSAVRNDKSPDVEVSKFSDITSSLLVRESLQGEGKKVTIDFVTPGESVPYMSIVMEDVLISSYSVSRHNSDRPMESLSLNYTKISYNVTPTKPSKDPQHAKDKTAWNFAVQNSRFT